MEIIDKTNARPFSTHLLRKKRKVKMIKYLAVYNKYSGQLLCPIVHNCR